MFSRFVATLRMKNESYLTQRHTKGFQNIKLVSFYSNSVSCENSKSLYFASVQVKHIVQNRQFLIFWKPLVCCCVKYDLFFHSVWNGKENGLF